jgi:hypothetical protein
VVDTPEVAMNKALTKPIDLPLWLDGGSISKMVPTAIMAAKPYISTMSGEPPGFLRDIT